MERQMPIERKALYNLLRMQWIQNPRAIKVEAWQVEDLTKLSLEQLFNRLQSQEIWLDQTSFSAYADNSDSPEAMTEHLLGDRELSPQESDQVFLVVFEIWKRLLPDRQSLTVFCDHLDNLIFAYDQNEEIDPVDLQDTIENLLTILVESTDEGNDPLDVFEAVCSRCANDLETFLYDYISDLINDDQLAYAGELIDGLLDYTFELKWFVLLKAKTMAFESPDEAQEIVNDLIEENKVDPQFPFYMGLLSVLSDLGNEELFFAQAKECAASIESREEYLEILHVSYEFFQRGDREKESDIIHTLIEKEEEKGENHSFDKNSEEFLDFLKVIKA